MMGEHDNRGHELPDWMRQALRPTDWGVILAIGLGLLAALPFFLSPSLPHTNATESYVYRTADYAQTLSEGRLVPRWSPNALSGYGAPIPHYYPPGAPYLAALIQLLITDDAVLGVRAVYILAFVGAAAAVYALVMRNSGAAAGLISTGLYVFSPYFGLTAPHILGDLPGMLMLALTPALLWAADRLSQNNRPQDFGLLALITAALCLTSIRGMLASGTLVVAYLIWLNIHARRIKRLASAIAAITAGLGIASVYWLPAIVEAAAVRWLPAQTTTNWALTLNELVAPLRQIDAANLIPAPQFTLGITTIIFGTAGLARTLIIRRHQKLNLFAGLASLALIVTALLAFPAETWLVGLITLGLSICSGGLMLDGYSLPPRIQRLLTPTLLVLIWISALPVWVVPVRSDPFGPTNAAAQIQHEAQGFGVAVLPSRDPLPVSIQSDLAPSRTLIESFLSGFVNKVAPNQVNVSIQVDQLAHQTHSDRFLLRRVAVPTSLIIQTANFPGWVATISGQIVPLVVDQTTGLLRAELPVVPTGNRELLVSLDSTDVRASAAVMSGLFAMVTLAVVWLRVRRTERGPFVEQRLLRRSEARLLAVALTAMAGGILLFAWIESPLSLRQKAGFGLEGSIPLGSRTDVGLGVTAFRLDRNLHQAGDSVSVTIYWQAQRAIADDYRARVVLRNNVDGQDLTASAIRIPAGFSVRRWNIRQYVADQYDLQLPSDARPGNYQIILEPFLCQPSCDQPAGLTFFDRTGRALGNTLTLPALITVSG